MSTVQGEQNTASVGSTCDIQPDQFATQRIELFRSRRSIHVAEMQIGRITIEEVNVTLDGSIATVPGALPITTLSQVGHIRTLTVLRIWNGLAPAIQNLIVGVQFGVHTSAHGALVQFEHGQLRPFETEETAGQIIHPIRVIRIIR